MLPMFLFASLTASSASAAGGAPAVSDEYVRASKNGEFISDYYPEGALKRGEQGAVAFQITIEPKGWVGSCEVTESSGFKALDRETCEIMVQFAQVRPVLNANGRAIRSAQMGHIVWRLPPGTVKLATATAKTMRKPDAIVCKRNEATGSNIVKSIQCLTRKEWGLQENFTRDALAELQGKGHSSQ